jgi:hypothetical protein
MMKKLLLIALVLLIPEFAFAGMVNIFVMTGSSSGSASPAGGYFVASKLITFTADTAAGYQLNKVTNNGVSVAFTTGAIVAGSQTYTYTVPLSSSTQTVDAYFVQPPPPAVEVLTASMPAAVTATAGTPQSIGGQTSTVSNATTPIFTFTCTDPSVTFSPASGPATTPSLILTSLTGTTAGTFNGTLTLSDTSNPGATATPAHFTITIVAAGVGGSSQCLACHAGWTQAVNYASSIHANNAHSTCVECHNNSGTGSHPFDVTTATVNPVSFIALQDISTSTGAGKVLAGGTFCTECHHAPYAIPHDTTTAYGLINCVSCHTPTGTGDAHSIQPVTTTGGATASAASSCVGCHAEVLNSSNTNLVHDNSGVRAITGANGEFGASTRNNAFGYRSHHIFNGTGVNSDPQDAQCIACHLEGTVGPNRTVVVDPANHTVDGNVHLRSGNTAIATNANCVWNPASPNQANMDNFCLSCHNGAGAVTAYANMSSALYGMTPIAGAMPLSATNPFGDQLTNAYDQKVRPGVVDVYDQFNPSNPSHHAVRAAKYSGRTRTPGTRAVANPAVFTQYSGVGSADIHKNANGVLTAYQVFGTYSTSGPATGFGPLYPGSRTTIYDAGLFVANYTTMDGQTLGDDSTLHCADCHSVGQWMSGSASAITWNNHSTSSGGYTVAATTAVIGAHGSQNEYMLRTSNGTDSLQNQSSSGTATRNYTNGNYVCFLCHTQVYYGNNSAAEYFQTNQNGNVQVLTLGTGAVRGDGGHGGGLGPCNGSAYSGYGLKGTARYGVIVNGKASPAIGNLFAMSCAHCHNSGQQNFGGIHGATGSYMSYSTNGVDVAGSTKATTDNGNPGGAYLLNVTHKNSYRFMGGEGIRYNGGSNPAKWEAQALSKPHREGCYNLSQTTDATHLWNTTTPLTAPSAGNVAIQNNGGSDSAWGVSDYTTSQNGRYGQNNATSGWGSCNHHQGSTTTGPTSSDQGYPEAVWCTNPSWGGGVEPPSPVFYQFQSGRRFERRPFFATFFAS